MKNLKVIFMGTPDFAVPILQTLIDKTNVIMVVTKMDAEVGRKKEIKYPPVKELALKYNIPVFQPFKIKEEYQTILDQKPDIIITCAYGQIIPKIILDAPKYGCINVHASLLPKMRGGAPLHHALIDGLKETGMTIMYMDEGMDTGDIISQEKLPITNSDNVGTLHDKLSIIGANLLIDTLPNIIDNKAKRIKQNSDEATFAYTIKREDERLSFNDTSQNIFNKVRGLNPWPLAYVILNEEETKIVECEIMDSNEKKKIGDIISLKQGIEVKTKDGSILITKIKPFGKKIMNAKDYLNGIKNKESLKIR